MDEKQTSPELSQAELRPSREDQLPPTRIRHTDDNSNDEPRRKRVRLTRKNLAEFNKMGKKKTSDLTDGSSTTTKTTTTTTSGFAVKARDNVILPPLSSKPPTNLEDIRKRHAKSRVTASPPESEYERYTKKVEKAGNEATIVVEVSSKLLKEYDDGYNRAYNRPFTGLPKNTGFNDGLSAPQPDFVEGLEIEEYRPFPVNKHLPGAALYQDDPYSLALPHVAGEWKGPNGSMREAELQSAYDGAALVHARTQALAHMGKSDPPGHAEIATFTTDGTNLNMYAHYAIPSAEDKDTLEYHQYRYASANVKDSYHGYKDGRKGLRNTQDHAKAQSEQLRDQLKQHWKQNHNQLPLVAEGVHPPDVELPPHAADGDEDASPHVLQEEGEEDEEDFEIVQPTTHKESSHPSSPHYPSSHNSSHKRKAPSSQASSHGSSRHTSKHGSYWKKNSEGGYFHKHSDGTVTWYDDVEDHHRH